MAAAAMTPDGAEPEALTVGPAKLLESLFEGTSNPRSASLTTGAEGAGRAVGEARTAGSDSDETTAVAATGLSLLRGRRAGEGRAALKAATAWPGDTGLELEGLLNEFVANDESEVSADPNDAEDIDGPEEENEDEEEEEGDESDGDEAGLRRVPGKPRGGY